MKDLKDKTIGSMFWSFADSFGNYFIKFGFSIAIARILSPEDYGLIGMIAIFIAISTMITESGFSVALIQKKNASQIDYSTIFYFNIFVAALLYLVIYFSAGAIADFYDQASLKSISRTLSLSIIISSLLIIHYTILSKQLNFKKQTQVNLFSALCSGIVGLFLAYKGFGVWALVIMEISGGTVKTILFWVSAKWYPSFNFSFQSLKSLYTYSYKVFLAGLSDTIFRNIYYPIIGKMFSPGVLGFYTRAEKLYDIFVRRISIAYGRVTFTSLSEIQDDEERFRRVYRKTYRLLIYLLVPFTTILIITANPFIHLLLSEKWMPVVPFIVLFYIEGFFFPLLMLNIHTFNAKGKSNISLFLEITKKVLTLSSIFVFFSYGISGLIIGQVISSFIVFIVSSFFINRLIRIDVINQLREFAPIILTCIPGIIYYKLIISEYITTDYLQIFFTVVGYLVTYLFFTTIFKIKAAKDFFILFENYVPQKIKNYVN